MNTKTILVLLVMGAVIFYFMKKKSSASSLTPKQDEFMKKATLAQTENNVTVADIENAISGKSVLKEPLTVAQVQLASEMLANSGQTPEEIFFNIPIPAPSIETQKQVIVNKTLNEIMRDMGQTGVYFPMY